MTKALASQPPMNKSERPHKSHDSAFSDPREFLGNRFVYALVSPRAGGLSIGVNMNPGKRCNFNCEYCEVDREAVSIENFLDVDVMTEELQRTLMLAGSGELRNFPAYSRTPPELMELKQVALSGDGEPTLCPNFLEVIRAVAHVRAITKFPFFKIVLITNASGLDIRDVQSGLELFTSEDEIWAKLDAGTQGYMDGVNHPDCPLEKIIGNILLTARQWPVTIQSLFPMINSLEPSVEEIEQYAQRLRDLKNAGAQIRLVQIYSAARPMAHPGSGHLSLKTLANIARRVREVSGLPAEVF
jgi:wyosine [tRNA(Phe)-imidazoG37] synthetase (radical SAM superfamily)